MLSVTMFDIILRGNKMRHAISLGQNCDVAFQLRMHGAENVPHFFDWLGTPESALSKVFDADFDIFHAENLVYCSDDYYVKDGLTGIILFHQFPRMDSRTTSDFMLFYSGFLKAFRFHARRFREYVTTLPVVLVRRDISEAGANAVEEAFFKRFPEADAHFLWLVHDNHEFSTACGHARHIPRTKSTLGDPDVWVKILSEEGLLEAPYKHSTAEILGLSHEDHALSVDDRFSEDQLKGAIHYNPRHPLFPIELARYYRKRGQFKEAEEAALLSLSVSPEQVEAKFEVTMARLHGKVIAPEDAASDLQLLLQGNAPGEVGVEAAKALLNCGRFEEARGIASETIAKHPLEHEAYFVLSSALYSLHELERAERAVAMAVRLCGRASHYLRFNARYLHELDRYAEEEALLRKDLLIQRDFYNLIHIGRCLENLGKHHEAIEFFEEAKPLAGQHIDMVERCITEANQRLNASA
jgi:tetratricopeptide (TPR) repeat protein